MKTYKELLESVPDTNSIVPNGMKAVGIEKGMPNYEKEHMMKFCDQISKAVQPELPTLIAHIETELNKFGRTLGEVDDTVDMDEDSGNDGFLIFSKANGELTNDVYLNLDWKRLTAASLIDFRHDAKLILSVNLTLEEVSPEELMSMIDDMENAELNDPDLSKSPNPSEDGFQRHDNELP